MFNSIYNTALSDYAFLICLSASLVFGFVFALLCSIKSTSSKSFYITTSLLPMAVTATIALVNGNIGIGVAVAGSFSLVRFRSAQGTAKEICVIFIAMASGIAFGTGYIAYGILFLIVSGLIILLLEKVNIFKMNTKEKILSITLPENMDYTKIFADVFHQYLSKYEPIKVKTTNMGSLFKIKYRVTLKNPLDEKKLIDDIRVKNGNLEVCLERADLNTDL